MKEAIIPAPKNENERIIARIDAVYDRLSDDPQTDDKRVLTYIRAALTAESIAARDEWEMDKDVKHLREVATQRLRRYETTTTEEGTNQ